MRKAIQEKYQRYDWAQPFDPEEYRRSPKAITMLYESWLQAEAQLDVANEEIEKLRSQLGNLDKKQALLSAELQALKKRKWIPFILQLVSAISGGIGVNLITSGASKEYGITFVAIFAMLELIAFFVIKMEG